MVGEEGISIFDEMIVSLKKSMELFPDNRKGKNLQYRIIDAASSAFSVFFTQCPSFLQYQKLMEQKYGLSNMRTLFGAKNIPSDNQIRNLLDEVSPDYLSSVFTDCFKVLKDNGIIDNYRVELGEDKKDVLIALDGTQYFSSNTLQCKNCSTKVKDGVKLYYHTAVTPTMVAPGRNKVISLAPSFITPQDGDSKQDCEIKASKRWINSQYPDGNKSKSKSKSRSRKVTILGDDLYAHEPFCKELLEKGLNFILTCKPESHKTLYEWIKGITKEQTVDRFDGKRYQVYTYKFVEGVPVRDGKQALIVNFVEVTVKDRRSGKQVYHNSFVTNHPLTGETDEETGKLLGTIIDCGRARWKIENENNNTLKNQGYHLEHNFGHGKKYLASILATMNILTFLFHTMLEFMDDKYQLVRKMVGSRKTLFNDIRTMLKLFCFKSFDSFLQFMIESLQKPADPETLTIPI